MLEDIVEQELDVALDEANAIGSGAVSEYMGGGVLWGDQQGDEVKTSSDPLHEDYIEVDIAPEKLASGTLPGEGEKGLSLVDLLGLSPVSGEGDGVYVQEDDPNRDRTLSFMNNKPEEETKQDITGIKPLKA